MRILLVDDEVGFVEALAERLLLRGFRPVVALDATQALRTLEAESFDAMVLDLRLPDANGAEVLRHARRHCPAMSVHVLTGHGTDLDRELCLGLGAVSFINKPIGVEKLALLLRGEEEAV
ncbi:response regulator [Pseudodesulfovibrio sp. F-1]|uniref:Response regulator n=1 Tax=Pseudodesulfovibrio alkaliphilus TaxID=2661613 RepID=A0A7K1KIW7_9BACT|nr:response regulator [Pseudodesulfovibrio alkaliphilus]MUM76028.1 response regulator [Pseudodesulfovibrio alkaliphilus]